MPLVATAAPTFRILLIEADAVYRAVLSDWMIEHYHYDVVMATGARQGLEMYHHNTVDAVVVDSDLPDGDAFDVCYQIQSRHPDATVPVLISGRVSDDEEYQRAFESGAQDYLKKPMTPEEVCARLQHALESSKLRQLLSEQNVELSSQVDERSRELEGVNRQLKLQLLNQQALFDVSQQLNSSINVDEQISILLLTVMGQIGVEVSALFTAQGEDHLMLLHAAKGIESDDIERVDLTHEEAFLRYIEANPSATMLRDLPVGVKTGVELKALLDLGFVGACPIHMGTRMAGIMFLGPKVNGRPMTDHDFTLLRSLAVSAGISMEKADLFKRLQESYVATIQSLMSAMEAKDTYTRGHTARVSRYSQSIGRALGFSKQAIEELRFGSTLHDIGKIGIHESILNKPSALTDEEYEIMREHPAMGDRILRKIPFLRNARLIVRHHHERWDGNGYPDKLAGEEISLGARIVAVADSFDAMTSKRTYNETMGLAHAIENMEECAGGQFCPDTALTFTDMLRQGFVPRPSWMKD